MNETRFRMWRPIPIAAMLVVLGWALPVTRSCAEPDVHGTMVRTHMASVALKDPGRSVRVYLPPSYESGTQRYPVIYMLHGWPGGDGNWPGSGRADRTLDSLIANQRIPEVIAVMPDGHGIGLFGRSMYLDSWDGSSRMEEFIVRELPAWVDSTYRTRSEAAMRGVLGLSDGGFGAINLAFKHPDVFGATASHSGYFSIKRDMSTNRIMGDAEHRQAIQTENSPLEYLPRVAPALTGMTIYFDCGVADDEIVSNREFDKRLTEIGVPHIYREYRGGHGWGYWRNHLHDSLIAITAKMR